MQDERDAVDALLKRMAVERGVGVVHAGLRIFRPSLGRNIGTPSISHADRVVRLTDLKDHYVQPQSRDLLGRRVPQARADPELTRWAIVKESAREMDRRRHRYKSGTVRTRPNSRGQKAKRGHQTNTTDHGSAVLPSIRAS